MFGIEFNRQYIAYECMYKYTELICRNLKIEHNIFEYAQSVCVISMLFTRV